MRVLLALLLAGVVEITVLIAVGNAIGVFPTLMLLLAGSVLGAWLLRREGRRALTEFTAAARNRRPPQRELADGVIIAAGGILIVLPGFVGDVVGLLCLLPPTRSLIRGWLGRVAERRAKTMQARAAATGYPGMRFGGYPGFAEASGSAFGAAQHSAARGDVIDGEVVSSDDDPPESEPPRAVPQ